MGWKGLVVGLLVVVFQGNGKALAIGLGGKFKVRVPMQVKLR